MEDEEQTKCRKVDEKYRGEKLRQSDEINVKEEIERKREDVMKEISSGKDR
jgi:hypothetical protein